MIRPLSGMDSVFLSAETPTTPMNVIATVVVEGPVDFEALVARIASRLPDMPPFRRCLVEMPLGLDHPIWIEDPDFDVREHVTRVSADAPGDDRALARAVARIARGRLDRARPLWEVVVVDGLCDDRTALVVKAHHAAVDGVSGAAMLLHLFDRPGDDAAETAETGIAWVPDAEPDAAAFLQHGMERLRSRPRALRDALQHAGRSVLGLGQGWFAPDPSIRQAPLPFQAPESPFNGPLSARRSVAYARTSRESVQVVRQTLGGTLNDVVLAACTRALQVELLERGAAPDGPLLAAIPVSTRTSGEAEGRGNSLSAFLTALPVQLEDPIHQLAEVRRASRRAKRFHSALGDQTLASLAELATPGLAQRALGIYGRWKLASKHRPFANVVIANVPGPPMKLAMIGQPVLALHPHGPLMEGIGLNITVLSYAGSIDVGVLASRAHVPEAHRLADRVASAFEELAKLADSALIEGPELARDVA